MRRTLAVALLGLGLGLTGAAPAPADAQTRGERTGTAAQPLRGGKVITGFAGIVDINVATPTGNNGCTGSMIAPNAILTAAHCLFMWPASLPTGSAGVAAANANYYDPKRGRRLVATTPVARWTIPPGYAGTVLAGPGDANDDIAVIVYPAAFTDTDYRDYIRIYVGEGAALERRLNAFGAGLFTYSGRTDNRLRTHWFEIENVAPKHIVVDNRDRVVLCQGDSGGPLVYTARASGHDVPAVAGVYSQGERHGDEPIACANNDPPEDDSFFARTNQPKIGRVLDRAGLRCTLFRDADQPYLRCFDLPFIETVPYEGWPRARAVAATAAAIL